jgi:hypothetical protein
VQLQAIRQFDTMDGETLSTRRIGLRAISRLRDSSPNFVNDAIKRQIATNRRNSQLAYPSERHSAGLVSLAIDSVNVRSAGSLPWPPEAFENQLFATLVRCEVHLCLSMTLTNGILTGTRETHIRLIS